MSNKTLYRTEQGVYYTQALFYETSPTSDRPNVVYTLKPEDHNGYPSLRKLYLECMDPTEYEFANKNLGGWDHWKKLCECEWFKPHLENWRDELEIKLKSLAYKKIMDKANDPLSRDNTRANEYIVSTLRRIQRNEDLGAKNTKGRPDKASIDKKALEIAQSHENIKDDFKRIVN